MINFNKKRMSKKIHWGIVGLGNIAHSFVKDLLLVADAEIAAVGSRSLHKAKNFASEYKIPRAFGNYKELFDCDEVDVIYIATPHNTHADLAIEAMNYGKHVLCEKPMGVQRKEVEKMVLTAQKNNVFLMEALWSRFNPVIKKVKERIDNGDIGKVRYLHADFAFYGLDREESGRILNPDLAGGSLLDIGIYPIFLSYLVLGKPDSICVSSNFYQTGVEIQTSMIFNYTNAQAILYSGLTSKSEMKAEISGEDGTVFILPRWHEAEAYCIEKNNKIENFKFPMRRNGYTHEIEEVHACLNKGLGESTLWSHTNSLDLIALLDDVREQAGIIFPFER